jgi:hypothetical protein
LRRFPCWLWLLKRLTFLRSLNSLRLHWHWGRSNYKLSVEASRNTSWGLTFARNNKTSGKGDIIPTSWIHSSFVAHEKLSGLPYPLYFGRDIGLYIDGHGAVCNPRESGDSGSMNCETPVLVKKFSFDVLFNGLELRYDDSR